MSWRTLIAYLVQSPNGEESLNKFSSPNPEPDPDHLTRGPGHGYNTSSVKKIKSMGAIVFELRVRKTYRHTDKQTEKHYPHTPLREVGR